MSGTLSGAVTTVYTACTGAGGLCSNASDAGDIVDCGEGVVTCLVASDGTTYARGCGLAGLDAEIRYNCNKFE